MTDAHILPNSILVADRSLQPSNKKIVLAVLNGEFLIKYFIKNSSGIRLLPANKKFQPISITDEMDFSLWGVVKKIILNV